MRLYLFAISIILTQNLFAYQINTGDKWKFLRIIDNTTDTTKFIAQSPVTIKNIQFHPIYDSAGNNIFIYLNATDSIISALATTYGNQTYYLISRVIRANVNAGDSWVDTTVIKPDTIWIVIESKVDSVNFSITVPAGTFNVTKISQNYKYVHVGITPPNGVVIRTVSWYINPNVIYPRIKVNITYPSTSNRDYLLINYQTSSINENKNSYILKSNLIVNGKLEFLNPIENEAIMKIYDLSGSKVMDIKLKRGMKSVDVSGLKRGIYAFVIGNYNKIIIIK